jgi:hypothetical protein
MRKFSFIVLLVIVVFNVQAQDLLRPYEPPGKVILKGSSALEGQFLTTDYYNNDAITQVKTTQYNFQPSIGKFVSHYILLGIFTGYNYKNTKRFPGDSDDNSYNKTKIFSIGPYIRCYFSDTKAAPFLHGEIGYARYSTEQQADADADIYSMKMPGMNFALGAGIEYFVERKYSFELLINYHGQSVSDSKSADSFYGPTTIRYRIDTNGFDLKLGISIILN